MSKETPQFIPPAGQALLNACWPSPGPLPLPLPEGVPPPAAAQGLNPLPLPWATALSFPATKHLAPVLPVHRPWTAIARGGHRGASHPGASAEHCRGKIDPEASPPGRRGAGAPGPEQGAGWVEVLSMTLRLPPQGGVARKQRPQDALKHTVVLITKLGPAASTHWSRTMCYSDHLLRAPYRPHTGQSTRTQHMHTHMYSAPTYLYIHMRAYTAHTYKHTTTHAHTHLHTPTNAQARIYNTHAHIYTHI